MRAPTQLPPRRRVRGYVPRAFFLAAIVVALVGTSVTGASAAVVELRLPPCTPGKIECPGPELVVEAAAGERNSLRIVSASNVVQVQDDGAVLSVGPGCVAAADRGAVCETSSGIDVRLGDQDDRLEVIGERYLRADGGAGDDELLGGAGPDKFVGGAGRDALSGREGDDSFVETDSALFGDADVIDGGPGNDSVGYDGWTAVRIDLLSGMAGARFGGDFDRLANIENASGGHRTDTVLGDEGPNRLSSGAGTDNVAGRGGDDFIDIAYSSALDVIDAGTGDDDVGSPGRRTRLRCGEGDDIVTSAVLGTSVADDCERVSADTTGPGTHVALRLPLASLAATFAFQDARGTLKVRATNGRYQGRLLARPSRRVRLNSLGRRLLRSHGRLEVQLRWESLFVRVVLRDPKRR